MVVGDKLRQLRTANEMTLRELAAESGLSATLLSQIERGVTEPSLKSLRRLAKVFGQSVSALFEGSGSTGVHVSRAGERSRISSPKGQVQYERVAPSNGQLEVLRGVLEPGEVSSEELWAHPSIECAFVMSGELTVQVGGASHRIPSGDAITLDSNQPHRYLNQGQQTVEFLLSVTPPTP